MNLKAAWLGNPLNMVQKEQFELIKWVSNSKFQTFSLKERASRIKACSISEKNCRITFFIFKNGENVLVPL